jgi:nitrogenase iron protein NifH
MKKIAIYGKGGIGKSTVASCLSASLAAAGKKVMQIGCDPKADSTMTLTGGRPPIPVIDYLRAHGVCGSLEPIVARGYGGVLCVEAGGPAPGVGCAGRGILAAFETLADLGAFEAYDPDFVLFDVLGDVVCGGFAAPIREGMADEVIIVSSGEKMSLYAAGMIDKALVALSDRGYARLRGIVGNLRGLDREEERIEGFARSIGSRVLAFIPRDDLIGRCEDEGKTIVEGAPDCRVAGIFSRLALSLSTEGPGS